MKKLVVGLPRAGLYHQYSNSWEKFLADLGFEVKISPPTSQKMKEEGIKKALAEICLPVKIFISHVIELARQPLDYLFIPRIVSLDESCFTCPKFIGLPDMIKSLEIEGLPPILEVEIDFRASDEVPFRRLGELSRITRLPESELVERLKAMHQEMIKPLPPIEYKSQKGLVRIGLVGPVYVLHDKGINLNLVRMLNELSADVVLQGRNFLKPSPELPKNPFWQPAIEIYNGLIEFMETSEIDGGIYLSAFPCGQHSMLEPVLARLKEENQWFPFQMLNLDEHTAEAGLKTRIQTFIDMIIAKKKAGKLQHKSVKYPYYSSPLSSNWLKSKIRLGWDLLKHQRGKGEVSLLLPNLGWDTLTLYYGFKLMGACIFPTPPSDQKTLDWGTALAPETACYPLKVCLGNFAKVLIENPEKFFILIFGGGCGPCRFGWYGIAIESCLRLRGVNNFEMVCFESFSPRGNRDLAQTLNLWRKLQLADSGFIKAFRYCSPSLSPLVVFDNLEIVNLKGSSVDKLLKESLKIRCRELHRGDTTSTFKKGLKLLEEAWTKEEIIEAERKAFQMLKKVPLDEERIVPKVIVCGEFYTVIDPFSNNNLLEELGDLGLEVDVFPYVFDWIRSGLNKIYGLPSKDIEEAALPYLSRFIGGDGWESVGLAVLSKIQGYDGFIHIAPFGCMPETVASEIIRSKIVSVFDLPVLTLLYDIQSGQAGYRTRIETFTHLIHIRKGTGIAPLIKRILKEAQSK